MTIPVGIQLFTLRDEMNADMIKTLRDVKEMGYDGVEACGLPGGPDYFKGVCDAFGLTVISAHVPFEEIRDDPESTFAKYASVGCKYIAIPYMSPGQIPGGNLWDECRETLVNLGKTAAEHGLTLLYHNHDFEFDTINGTQKLDVMFESVPDEFLKTEIDICWANVGGVNPAEYIEKYSGRSPVVHLKDFYKDPSEKDTNKYKMIDGNMGKKVQRPASFSFRPVGYGVQDIPSVLKAAKDAGTEWVIVEQDATWTGKTITECAKMSVKYLKSLDI